MATTHDYVIANASGAAVRTDLNNALAAIVSNNSSATEGELPTTYPYMLWADTTAQQLKMRNAANDSWYTILDIDGTLLRDIPQNSQTSSYSLTATDAGKHISITTGGVIVPANVLTVGNVVTIYNNSSSNQTITQGSSVTLRLVGTSNTGDRTLAQYGLCSVLCVASNVFVISGVGLG